ncbi:MAG: DedA family protein [Acidobacteriota bacterium]|nr:DedA family protein [Blastocatellia bacterium]MDW8238221.1 DedA family protein [Acidobacteriota bacterium]
MGIFSLLMLGIIGIPIPDEAVLTFAGYLIYKGDLHPVATVAAAFLGSVCGITVSYGLGRTVGLYLVEKYGHLVHLRPAEFNRVHQWFDRVGKWGLLFGYFLPGARHVIALVAGSTKLRLPVFAAFAYTGGFIWSATFIVIGYFLGEEWVWVSTNVHRPLAIGSCSIILLLLLYWVVQRKKSYGK